MMVDGRDDDEVDATTRRAVDDRPTDRRTNDSARATRSRTDTDDDAHDFTL
jgi:hypothetical protein